MAYPQPEPSVRIIERTQISPPSGSVPRTHLPLTFFDYPWLTCTPQRLFFFDLPRPTDYFTLTVIPKLKSSLSTALIDFFPFAADLIILPPPPQKPHFLFDPATAAVSFTAAVSGADFHGITSHEPRDARECHTLVPELAYCGRLSLLAVQVTVFPDVGFSIGFSFGHVAADGRAFNHFVKSWASICGCGLMETLESPPCHDRNVIMDWYGLEPTLLNDWRAMAQTDSAQNPVDLKNMVRATFVMSQAHIERLKDWVSAHSRDEASRAHVSSFVVVVAFTWANLVRSKQAQEGPKGDEMYHVGFPADYRNRTCLESLIPTTYFGNCLTLCFASVKRSDLVGEKGIFYAAKAIGKSVLDLDKGSLMGGDMFVRKFKEIRESGNICGVAGSASLRVYQTDFGWGKPRKSLSIHIDVSGAMSLAECPNEGGGMEIGLALDKDQMNKFSALFQRGLELF